MPQKQLSNPRTAGVLIPVWTLRHENDLGIGDVHALLQTIDWAADHRIGFIQLLPLNETGNDHSPYNAISSVAFEPALLDMATIPGLTSDDLAQARKLLPQSALQADHLDYPIVKKTKRTLLEKAYRLFCQETINDAQHPARLELDAFKNANPGWLPDYCLFRWLQDKEGGVESWPLWSMNYNCADKARAYLADQLTRDPHTTNRELDYYAWVQWQAFTQWGKVRAHADQCGVQLMGDIPIGVSHDSADVFLQPQWFDLNWFGGAPPETVFKDDAFACKWGQNWGVPHYNWEAIEADDYRWWKRRIGKLTDLFHLFRIDHILGFYRIYSFPWHPKRNAEFLPLSIDEARERTGGPLPGFLPRPDDTPEQQKPNLAHGHQHLSKILEVAEASQAGIIGEDLGCTPDYVRPHLLENNIAGFNICHWHQTEDGHALPGGDYDECTFATYATHDHPPLSAMWDEFYENTLSDDPELQTGGHWNIRILSEFSGLCQPEHDTEKEEPLSTVRPYDNDLKWPLLKALLNTKSRYAALMITELFDIDDRFNVPGTTGNHNWTYRLPHPVSAFQNNPTLKKEATTLKEAIHKANR